MCTQAQGNPQGLKREPTAPSGSCRRRQQPSAPGRRGGIYRMSGCREQMGGRAWRPDTRLAGQTGGQTPCLPPASPPPLVLLHRVLGGTDGAGSGVPPQCPPFPKPAWALAAYARAQEDLVGEVGGGHLPVGAGCPCGGPWGSARGAGAGPCPDSKAGCLSAASLAPRLVQAPCCSPAPPPPYWGASCLSSPPSAPP